MPDNQLVIAEREHARVSPSSFERVEACSQSVRLSAYAQPRLAGPEARSGTAQHGLLELALKEDLDTFELADIETVKVDGHEVAVTDDMLEAVQVALDWVRENLKGPLLIEKQVRLAFADPYLGSPMFGLLDVATEQGPPWTVVDFKSGFNLVEANAVQLGLYLLGLALEHDPTLTRDGPAGTTVIIQPNARAETVRSFDYSFKDLRDLRERVVQALSRLKRKEWRFQAGPWCRYCPAAAICPHLYALARDPALTALSPSPEAVARGDITREMIEDALDRAEIIEAFIKKLYAVAEDYLLHGGKLRNRKLVRKRTNRRWLDEGKALARLEELGVDPWQPREIVSPAEAEKRLPRGKRAIVNAELAEQPLGELTIAPMSDTKPAIEIGQTMRAAVEAAKASGLLARLRQSVALGEKTGTL